MKIKAISIPLETLQKAVKMLEGQRVSVFISTLGGNLPSLCILDESDQAMLLCGKETHLGEDGEEAGNVN